MDLSPITDALYELEGRMAGLEDEMRSVNLAVDAAKDEQIKGMMHHVRKYLPLVESEEELQDLQAKLSLPPDELARVTGTIRDIADALRGDVQETANAAIADENDFIGQIDVWDVERTLERLAREVERIHVTVQEGERRYYEVRN